MSCCGQSQKFQIPLYILQSALLFNFSILYIYGILFILNQFTNFKSNAVSVTLLSLSSFLLEHAGHKLSSDDL